MLCFNRKGFDKVVTVVFECYENMNEYKEEFEFEDDITNEKIEKEFTEWVWEQIRDNFGWRRQ